MALSVTTPGTPDSGCLAENFLILRSLMLLQMHLQFNAGSVFPALGHACSRSTAVAARKLAQDFEAGHRKRAADIRTWWHSGARAGRKRGGPAQRGYIQLSVSSMGIGVSCGQTDRKRVLSPTSRLISFARTKSGLTRTSMS